MKFLKLQGINTSTFFRAISLIFLFFVIIIGVTSVALGKEVIMKKNATMMELPKPVLKGSVSIEETIQKRRSVRSFSDRVLTAEQISQLLWAVQGITNKRGLRSAPSAGALYPLEIYLVSRNGLYHYIPQGHKLEIRTPTDLRLKLSQASWRQNFIANAPVNIVICAVYERVVSRYGKRGSKYVDIEVGHAAENLHLQAVALGLSSVPIGAFDDDAVSAVLRLPDEEDPIYIIPVGYAE